MFMGNSSDWEHVFSARHAGNFLERLALSVAKINESPDDRNEEIT
jgi:hypothetical protein